MTQKAQTSFIAVILAVIGIGAGGVRAQATNLTSPASGPEGWKIFALPGSSPSASPVNVSFDVKPMALEQNVNLPPVVQDFAAEGKNLQTTDRPASKTTPPAVSVPLPSAAWTSLTGLIGLGLIGYWRKIIRIFA